MKTFKLVEPPRVRGSLKRLVREPLAWLHYIAYRIEVVLSDALWLVGAKDKSAHALANALDHWKAFYKRSGGRLPNNDKLCDPAP